MEHVKFVEDSLQKIWSDMDWKFYLGGFFLLGRGIGQKEWYIVWTPLFHKGGGFNFSKIDRNGGGLETFAKKRGSEAKWGGGGLPY